MCWFTSEILQFIYFGLHRIQIVSLLRIRIGNCSGTSTYLAANGHLLLVTHLIQQVHDFIVVDRSGVDVIKRTGHLLSLYVHVLKNAFEVTY